MTDFAVTPAAVVVAAGGTWLLGAPLSDIRAKQQLTLLRRIGGALVGARARRR